MRTSELNSILVEIVERRMELGRLQYSDEAYDELEEELHHVEDEFIAHFGPEMESVLQEIHHKYCPDTEVLSPIAYLSKAYTIAGKHEDGTSEYSIPDHKQGVIVSCTGLTQAQLVLIPNPVRLVLVLPTSQELRIVWTPEEMEITGS